MLQKAVIGSVFGMLLLPFLSAQTWTADNGNGTFTNPLFYDEFSDPDMIRVGKDFYLTGTTMHSMPGLPILHSRDLVNWHFVGYAVDRLDLGPAPRIGWTTAKRSMARIFGHRAFATTTARSTSSAMSTDRRRRYFAPLTPRARGRAPE
jgi:hypothetical protein